MNLAHFIKQYHSESALLQTGEVSDRDFLKRKLTDILPYVTSKSKFYHEKFSGIHLKNMTPENLTMLPLTSKEELRTTGLNILTDALDAGCVYYESSGTTGSPIPCPRNAIDNYANQFAISHCLGDIFNHTFTENKPMVAVIAPPELHSFADVIGGVLRSLNISYLVFWPYSATSNFTRLINSIKKLNINSIIASPTMLLQLTRSMLLNNCVEPFDSIKTILLLGECLSKNMHNNICSFFTKAKCFDALYGSQETLIMAGACIKNNLHIFNQNHHIEVVTSEHFSDPAHPERGECVTTLLIPGLKPLIRYRTGDIIALGKCPCGLSSATLETYGRVQDVVLINHTYYTLKELENTVLTYFSLLLDYKIYMPTRLNPSVISISILLGKSNHSSYNDAAIQHKLEEKLGIKVTLKIQVLSAHHQTDELQSWKSKRLIIDNKVGVPT